MTRYFLLIASLLLAIPTVAQTRRPLAAVARTGPPPTIDGNLTDSSWQAAAHGEGFTDLQLSVPATDQTIAHLLYDETYLYVAFDCRDARPDGVIGRETQRDSLYQGGDSSRSAEDWVEVSFDPFLSFKGNDFARFAVNPLGTRSARIGGGRAGKAEWNGDWDAAAQRTPTGWSAELRIPWKTLNYPASRSGQPITIGLNFTRFQYRTQTRSAWSDTGRQNFDEQEGRWLGVVVPKNAFHPTLSVLPYSLSVAGNGATSERLGLDARYQATPDLTVVTSVNPDFATVEGAVQNIAFSRSEQFVEERRPFFLEGGDYFRAGTFFSLGPLFYSRRIESFDIGTKAFGKLTPRDTIGVLVTEDLAKEGAMSRTDYALRYRRDLSPTVQAGVFATGRQTAGDRSGTLGMLAEARQGKVGLSNQLFASGGTDGGGRAAAWNAQYYDSNHFTSLQYLTTAPNYRDPNGLVFFTDTKGFQGYHNWSQEFRSGTVRSFSVDFGPSYKWHFDGRPFERGASLGVYAATRSDLGLSIGADHFCYDSQTDRTINLRLGIGETNRFQKLGFRLQTGTRGGSAYRFYGPNLSLRVLQRLDLNYSGGLQQQNGWSRQNVVSANYLLSRTRQVGGRVVRTESPGARAETSLYVSYRDAGERGLETFLLLGDPTPPQAGQARKPRQVALKFIYAI